MIPSRKVFTIQYENGSRDIIHACGSKFRSNMDLGKYPRYQGEIAFAYGLGVGEVSNHFNTDRLVFETVHGIRVNPYLFTGLGAAFNLFYTDMPAYNEEGEEFGTYTSAGVIPVFVNLKGYYPVSDKFSLYVSLDLGAAFGVSGYLEDRDTEFYTSVGPGVNFGRVVGFPRGDFSIRFQHMGEGTNAILLRIGFGF